MTPTLRVERPGAQSLVEDRGRPGHARWGITGSGAWDRSALTLANRLAGNPEDAAGLEVLLGGLVVTALADAVVVVTGADAPVTVDGRTASQFVPLALRAGARLEVGTPTRGLRCYLAVRGGVGGRAAFGSLSASPTAGIGPTPLVAGDVLHLAGRPTLPLPGTDVGAAGASMAGASKPDSPLVLRAIPGPRDDWFTPEALTVLSTATWVVADATDRVGTRLLGPVLARSRHSELPSEPLVRGAVQVPASGQPLVFGPDHPTTGGYPVLACVVGDEADALAQAAPGTGVRFELVRRPW